MGIVQMPQQLLKAVGRSAASTSRISDRLGHAVPASSPCNIQQLRAAGDMQWEGNGGGRWMIQT